MLARIVFAALLALPFFWRLGTEEFHGDESHWISSGQQGFYLFTAGHFSEAQWRDEFYFYSQPQVGKLLIGAALALGGRYGPTRIYDYDWQRKPYENRAAGRVPPDDAVLAGRVPGAIAGWLSCLLLWAIAATLGAPAAGPLAAALLASHPLWLANARRAGLDATSLCFGLLAAWAVLKALRQGSHIAWWLLAGLALGLAAGDKYVGILPLALAAPAAIAAGERSWRAAGRTLLGGSLALVLGGAVFFLANPTLYRRPLYQLRVSVDFLTAQAQEMRHDAPAFASPVFVAMEMFDRAVWPTGDPKIVDRTLPEPLTPGSYGTPVVAFGAALGLVAAAFVPARRRAPLLVAAAGTAIVYALLALSIPTWWERWHLPLIPPLCLLAGMGLAWLGDQYRNPLRAADLTPWPPSRDGKGERQGAAVRQKDRYRVQRSPIVPPSSREGGQGVRFVLPITQYVAALAMEPSYLGRGFGALALTPFGAVVHGAGFALTLALAALALRGRRRVRSRPFLDTRKGDATIRPAAPPLPFEGEGVGG